MLDALGLNGAEVFREFPSIRNDLKVMLLAFINGKATWKQQRARSDRRLFSRWNSKVREITQWRIEVWRQAGILQFRRGKPTSGHVLKAFRKAHAPIRENFSTGCGLYLQSIDAEIARRVLRTMMLGDEVIPTLPIHDSFITLRTHRAKLEAAMEGAYESVMQEITGRKTAFQIRIKYWEKEPQHVDCGSDA